MCNYMYLHVLVWMYICECIYIKMRVIWCIYLSVYVDVCMCVIGCVYVCETRCRGICECRYIYVNVFL